MTAPESREDSELGRFPPASATTHTRDWGQSREAESPRAETQTPTWLLSTGRASGHHKPEKLLSGPELGNPLLSLGSPLQLLTSSSFLLGDGTGWPREQWGQTDVELLWRHQVLEFSSSPSARRLRDDCGSRVQGKFNTDFRVLTPGTPHWSRVHFRCHGHFSSLDLVFKSLLWRPATGYQLAQHLP